MTRKCTKCGRDKNLKSDFRKHKRYHDGIYPMCKECDYEATRKWRQDNPQLATRLAKSYKNEKRYHLNKYWPNLNLEEARLCYEALLKEQEYKCSICERHVSEIKRNLAVDHCHNTGKVRSLLCDRCNRGLGMFKDSPDLLVKASEYIKKHQNSSNS